MKIKKVVSAVLVVLLLLSTTGCSLNFFSTETLLKPPALSGKSGEVQEAFNKLMSGKTILLKTPSKGEFKSSFVLQDIDGDNDEEAIVFYTDSSTDTTVRFSVLDCVNDKWILADDIKGAGSDVYDVAFRDLNGDRFPEIIISWSLFDTNLTKMLTVYNVTNTKSKSFTVETLANEYFSSKSFIDLNSNGTDDLIIVYLDDAGEIQNSYFRAFSMNNDGVIVKFSEVLLDSSITSVSALNTDEISTKTTTFSRVFIDCLKSDNSIFTEVLIWDVKTSKVIRQIEEPSKNTLRNSKLLSYDIDNDGNLEVPVNTKFFTDSKDASVVISGVPYSFTMIEWKNITGDNSERKIKTLYNPVHSYLFEFPWGENVTVNFDKIENETNFCIWNTNTKEVEDILFYIVLIDDENDVYRMNENYDENNVLLETENGIFVYEITSYGENYGITDELIKSSFIKV